MRRVTLPRGNRRWRASFQKRYLGEFQAFEDACAARVRAEQAHFGRAQDQADVVIAGDHAKLPIFNRSGAVVAWALVDIADLWLVRPYPWCKHGQDIRSHGSTVSSCTCTAF